MLRCLAQSVAPRCRAPLLRHAVRALSETTGTRQAATSPVGAAPTQVAHDLPPTGAGAREIAAHELKQQQLAEQYEQLTDREHIIKRPDTYVGSIAPKTERAWVWNEDGTVDYTDVHIAPALLKIFDEIMVNASDQYHRMRIAHAGRPDAEARVTEISVEINVDTGVIRVKNNGQCLTTAHYAAVGMYVPELVFGELRSGGNFNDNEQRITGGRNGYGAKLTNIFSREFKISIGDVEHKRRYEQTWWDNMSAKGAPMTTPYTSDFVSDFTEVEFTPDFGKLGIAGLTKDIAGLFALRAADIIASTGINADHRPELTLVLNHKTVDVGGFEEFIEKHYAAVRKESAEGSDKTTKDEGDTTDYMASPRLFTQMDVGVKSANGVKKDYTWQVVVGPQDKDECPSSAVIDTSFVNSVRSPRGTHVAAVKAKVVRAVVEHIKKRRPLWHINNGFVEQRLAVFVNSVIPNPAWSSQCKVELTGPTRHAFTVNLPEDFVEQLVESKLVQGIMDAYETKNGKRVTETTVRRVAAEKLDDARFAGVKGKSLKCNLLVTEGDSAKALAVAGLGKVGREYWGVMPLRGKAMNVSKQTEARVDRNKELEMLRSALGLDKTKTYETNSELQTLRYGRVVLMCDQDHDGAHIKGLVLNYLNHYWPKLMQRKVDGSQTFVCQFVTPLVKARKVGGQEKWFFNVGELEAFKKTPAASGYTYKYYKGLGTSSNAEGKVYFQHIKDQIDGTGATSLYDMRTRRMLVNFKPFKHSDREAMVKAFGRNVERRRAWFEEKVPERDADTASGEIAVTDFFDHDLRAYFDHSNERAIPSCADGLKPSQRKILFTCFDRGLDNKAKEIKVAHLGAAVAEHTAYHHGESSLHQAIIKMAQNFVGSGNNINLLEPLGQFGSRLEGGSDHASPRYIYTRLSPLARLLFPPEDDALLTRRIEENDAVEPEVYAPVIPMVLVNTQQGVGTGMSVRTLSHDPIKLAQYLIALIHNPQYLKRERKAAEDVRAALAKEQYNLRKRADADDMLKKMADQMAEDRAKAELEEKGVEVCDTSMDVMRPTMERISTARQLKLRQEHPEYLAHVESCKSARQELAAARSMNPIPDILSTPYYHGFTGTISKIDKDEERYRSSVEYAVVKHAGTVKAHKLEELPVGVWTDAFTQKVLDDKDSIVRDVTRDGDESTVSMTIHFKSTASPQKIEAFAKKYQVTLVQTRLITLWSCRGDRILDFTDARDVIVRKDDGFFDFRRRLYEERRKMLIKDAERAVATMERKIEFYQMCVASRNKLFTERQQEDFVKKCKKKRFDEKEVRRQLQSLTMRSLTDEAMAARRKKLRALMQDLEKARQDTVVSMWSQDLTNFVNEYAKLMRRTPTPDIYAHWVKL